MCTSTLVEHLLRPVAASGTLGKTIVKLCADAGHHTIQINRTDENYDAFEGCDAVIHLAAIPDPSGKDDWKVHNNNVNSAFNGFHAAGNLGIKKVCYASSVNAIGLAYSHRPLHFEYFPIDEEAPQRPTDSYALAKAEAEYQARCFVDWFPGMSITCMRIHEVAPLKDVQKEHQDNWEGSAVRQLWGWVHPQAVARACLLAVEKADSVNGFKIFNIVAPTTTQSTPSEELAKRYFAETEIRGNMSKNQAFWTTDRAKTILGWVHDESE